MLLVEYPGREIFLLANLQTRPSNRVVVENLYFAFRFFHGRQGLDLLDAMRWRLALRHASIEVNRAFIGDRVERRRAGFDAGDRDGTHAEELVILEPLAVQLVHVLDDLRHL